MTSTYQHATLAQADTTLDAIFELIVEGVWDWCSDTGHVIRSPGWYRMLDYPIGIFQPDIYTWENLIHAAGYDRVMAHFEAFVEGQSDVYCIEYRCKKADGSYLWIEDRGVAVSRNEQAVATRIIGAHHNIHRQKMAEQALLEQAALLKNGSVTLEQLLEKKALELEQKNHLLEQKLVEIESISNTDTLTAIANRKKFHTEIEKEIDRSSRYQQPLSLIMFDIDHFKLVNDTFGHKVGDEVLQAMTQTVSNNLRSIDCFARWGGEEFMIILPGIERDAAVDAAEKFRRLIIETTPEGLPTITCSFGVVQYIKAETADRLLQRVDSLLYQAKQGGRNCIHID